MSFWPAFALFFLSGGLFGTLIGWHIAGLSYAKISSATNIPAVHDGQRDCQCEKYNVLYEQHRQLLLEQTDILRETIVTDELLRYIAHLATPKCGAGGSDAPSRQKRATGGGGAPSEREIAAT